MNQNYFMEGGLSLFVCGANNNPNHHNAFVSGQLEFKKKLDLRWFIRNAHRMWFLSALCVGLSINQSEEASVQRQQG